jgi:hypothetical protein
MSIGVLLHRTSRTAENFYKEIRMWAVKGGQKRKELILQKKLAAGLCKTSLAPSPAAFIASRPSDLCKGWNSSHHTAICWTSVEISSIGRHCWHKMVYCGKPSRGCQICRSRRIKVSHPLTNICRLTKHWVLVSWAVLMSLVVRWDQACMPSVCKVKT